MAEQVERGVFAKWKPLSGKSVMSSDVLLRHTGERAFCCSKRMNRHMMFRRNIDMTFAPPRYSSLTTRVYWFALHFAAELPLC